MNLGARLHRTSLFARVADHGVHEFRLALRKLAESLIKVIVSNLITLFLIRAQGFTEICLVLESLFNFLLIFV